MKNILDLHTHSIFSRHAYSSLTENIDYALNKGIKFYGIADHQYDNFGVGANRWSFYNLRIVEDYFNDMRFLRGMEINAGPSFFETINDHDVISRLDYGIASFHYYAYKPNNDIEKNTSYMLDVMNHDFIKIIGHIDDGQYLLDYHSVIENAKLNRKFIEINNSSLKGNGGRLNSYENMKTILKICKEIKCPVILSSDAHIKYDIGNVDLAYQICKDNGLNDELIANTNIDLFKDYFHI